MLHSFVTVIMSYYCKATCIYVKIQYESRKSNSCELNIRKNAFLLKVVLTMTYLQATSKRTLFPFKRKFSPLKLNTLYRFLPGHFLYRH